MGFFLSLGECHHERHGSASETAPPLQLIKSAATEALPAFVCLGLLQEAETERKRRGGCNMQTQME